MPPKSSFSPHAIPPIEHNKNRIPPRPTPFSLLQRKAITGPNTIHKKILHLTPLSLPLLFKSTNPARVPVRQEQKITDTVNRPSRISPAFPFFVFPQKKCRKSAVRNRDVRETHPSYSPAHAGSLFARARAHPLRLPQKLSLS